MAAGTLPKPGTKFGPCVGECVHRDCAATRAQASAIRAHCDTAIGYETRFYEVFRDEREFDLAHASCVERVAKETGVRIGGAR